MLKPKCFIIGMLLSLSLQVKAFTPINSTVTCASATTAAANAANVAANERREQEQIEQLNKLLNERIEQGKMIEITTDKNVKLPIKPRKTVDATVGNKELSLTECILDFVVIFIAFGLMFLVFFIIDRWG